MAEQKTDFRPRRAQAPAGFPEVGSDWTDHDDPTGASASDGGASHGARRRIVVVSGVAVAIVIGAAVGMSALLHSGTGSASSPGVAASGALSATQAPQDPGVLGEHEPPGAPTVTAHRTSASAGTVAFTWTYSAQLSSDTYLWRTTDGKRSGTAKSASLTLPDPPGTQLCVQVKVVRADGSDASVDWSTAGCGS